MSVNAIKTNAIIQWWIPHSIKAMQSFLELFDYYRKFIHDYGQIATSLTRLLKNHFKWEGGGDSTILLYKLMLYIYPIVMQNLKLNVMNSILTLALSYNKEATPLPFSIGNWRKDNKSYFIFFRRYNYIKRSSLPSNVGKSNLCT